MLLEFEEINNEKWKELSFEELIGKGSTYGHKMIEKMIFFSLKCISENDDIIFRQIKEKLQQQDILLKIGSTIIKKGCLKIGLC